MRSRFAPNGAIRRHAPRCPGARVRTLTLLMAGAVAWVAPVSAQESGIDWFSATGRFTTFGELYGRTGIGEPARPARTARVNGQMTFSFANGALVVPVSLILATDQVAFRQNINQLGITPSWRWATLYAGHFSPEYSPYSLEDATLLGGGAAVDTDGLRVGLVAGQAREAIAPTPGQRVVPEYRRVMQAARLGVGRTDGVHVDAFVLHAEDDPASLDKAALSTPLAPEANFVASVRGGAPISDVVALQAEVALSTFEADRRADLDAVGGAAGRVAIDYTADAWSAGVEFEQVDGGFHNLGNTGLKNDRRDLRLRGQGRFREGALALSGSIGLRQDNLSDAQEVTNQRTIANLAGTIQPWPAFGVDFQVANDRQQADAVIRSRSQKTVTGNYTVTPRLIFRTGTVQHVVFVMAGFQGAVHTSPGTETTVDTRNSTYVGNWSVTLQSGLTLTANATHVATEFDQDSIAATTTVTTLAPGVAYTTLEGRLNASLQLQHTRTRLESDAAPAPNTTAELFPVVEVRYALDRSQSLVLRSSYRRYDMTDGATLPGDPAGTGTFTERRISLGYTVTLR